MSRKYRAVLFAPDGDWVTDFESDTIEEVRDKLADRGSRWYFYPFDAVILSHPHVVYGTQRIIDAPTEFHFLVGKTIKTFTRFLRDNPDVVAELLS